jgi:anaerobic magnesium-protoporphyrin IX monomethyl ester cyclase
MKALLINPPVRSWAQPNCFPIGLGYIAAVLQQAGHDVEILDINALRPSRDRVETCLRNSDADLVGIGGIITTYGYVKWLAAVWKQHHPGRPVVVGGAVASSIPDTILSCTEADIAVMGEGELTAPDLLRCLAEGGPLDRVRGILYKDADGVHATLAREMIADLDVLPLPAWALVPMEVYLANPVGVLNKRKWSDGAPTEDVVTMNVSATRGCPFRCKFCYHDFLGYRYRTRGPESVMGEVRVLAERYGVQHVQFTDDEFMARRSFVDDFCRLMEEANPGVTWGCAGRVNLVDDEIFTKMKRAGCISVAYGIESGSQRMLDLMDKRVTVEEAERALVLTERYFGDNDISLMIGFPGETEETVRETIDFCLRTKTVPEVVFFATPYPGTELYRMAQERNRISDEEQYVLSLGEQGENIACNLSEIPDGELRQLKDLITGKLGVWNGASHERGN